MRKDYSGYDKIYSRLPEISRYQLKIFFIASFSIILSGCVQNASVLLNARPQNFRCAPPGSDLSNISYEEIEQITPSNPCRMFENSSSSEIRPQKCERCTSGFIMSPKNIFKNTAVTEFNWLCEENSSINSSELSISIFMLGLLFGAVIFGKISDKIGRKQGLILAFALELITNFLLYFSSDPFSFTILRFFAGAFAHACVVVSYVYVIEQIGPSWRTFIGSQHLQFFELGIVVLSIIGYYNRDWHDVQLAFLWLGIPFFPIFFALPKSTRWLYSKGRTKEARENLKLLSEKTNESIDDNFIRKFEEKFLAAETENPTSCKSYGFRDLFKNTKLRKITIIMCFNWFVTSMVYYGLGLNAGSLSGDIFMNNALCGVFDAIAKLVAPLFLRSKLGRRGSLCFLFVIGGICCLGSMIVKSSSGCLESGGKLDDFFCEIEVQNKCENWTEEVSKWLALGGKFCSSATFTIVYVFTAELYPTCIRATALGVASAGGRIGGAISPLVFGLDKRAPGFSSTFFGLAGILAGYLTLRLPETQNRPMLQSMADLHNLEFPRRKNVKIYREKDLKRPLLDNSNI